MRVTKIARNILLDECSLQLAIRNPRLLASGWVLSPALLNTCHIPHCFLVNSLFLIYTIH